MSVQEFTRSRDRRLLSQLRQRLSPYVYLNDVDEEHGRADIGIEIQEMVIDHARDQASAVKFLSLDNVASVSWKGSGLRVDTQGLTRTEFVKRVREKYVTIIDHSHRALLPSLYRKLVRIPEVSVAMTPLKKILLRIDEYGIASPKDFGKREAFKAQTQNYFGVLAGLGYIRPEGRRYVAGPAMRNLQAGEMAPEEVYELILGEVLQRKRKYLTEVLHWTMIVPYLHWCNAYYLPAAMAGHLVRTAEEELVNNYSRFYEGFTYSLEVDTVQLNRVVKAEILSKEGSYYDGYQQILENYISNAERDPLLEAVVSPRIVNN